MNQDDDTESLESARRHWAGRWIDSYEGKELLPFDGRPGAMQAFALPSRTGSIRTFRCGRVEKVEQ